jgi:Domain of unknown function (DUF6916)
MAAITRAHPGGFESVSLGPELKRLSAGLASNVSRRELLVGSVAGTAAMLAMGPLSKLGQSSSRAEGSAHSASASSGATTATVAFSALALDHFSALIGEAFQVVDGGERATLILSDVTALEATGAARPRGVRPEGFSLLFDIDSGILLENGIVTIEHKEIGRQALFLHRVGLENGSTAHYEAVFN